MKKIFTLLVAISLATAALAQYGDRHDQGNERNNDVAFNDRHDNWRNDRYSNDGRYYDRHYYFEKREMEKEIAEINREYSRKICNVRENCFISPFKKQCIINELENRRNCEIREVYEKFRSRGQRRQW